MIGPGSDKKRVRVDHFTPFLISASLKYQTLSFTFQVTEVTETEQTSLSASKVLIPGIRSAPIYSMVSTFFVIFVLVISCYSALRSIEVSD